MNKPQPAKLAALSAELARHSSAIARRVDTWATLLNDTADPETLAGWRSLEKACRMIGSGAAPTGKPTTPPSNPTANVTDRNAANAPATPRRVLRRPRPEGGAMA